MTGLAHLRGRHLTLGSHGLVVSVPIVAVPVAVLAALVVTTVLLVSSINGGGPGSTTSTGGDGVLPSPSDGTPVTVTMTGTAPDPLVPGATSVLDLELTNPTDTSIAVAGLLVTVQDLSAPAADAEHLCERGDFAVEQSPGGLEVSVPARTTSTLSALGVPAATLPRIGLRDRDVNQDGCKLASVTLEYTASVAEGA